jgi:hypothetical protein
MNNSNYLTKIMFSFLSSLKDQNMFKIFLVLGFILSLGCAKVRETNVPGDGNHDRLAKSTFTGLDAEKSNELRPYADQFDPENKNYNKGAVWLNKITVVNTSSNDGFAFTGYQGRLSAGYFVFSRKHLQFRSAVNNRVGLDPAKYDDLVYEWPVEHSEYRYNEVDGRTTNSLIENLFENWQNKDYFTIDFSNQTLGQDSFFPYSMPDKRCWVNSSSEVIDESRKLSEDYMSYVVRKVFSINTSEPGCVGMREAARENFTYQVDYLFSFAKVKEPEYSYEPLVYNSELDPLYQKYGYFTTAYEDASTDFTSRKVKEFANRFNPRQPVHKFYFAPGFPEKYKWIYKTEIGKKDPEGKQIIGVIDQTNKLFKGAYDRMKKEKWPSLLAQYPNLSEAEILEMHPEFKQPMQLEILDAPEGVEYGDLRYSFIKFITEVEPQSPLGYGPSDDNPFTGEIISSNSMIWTGYLENYVRRISEEIKRSGVQGSDLQIYSEMAEVLGGQKETWDQTISGWVETANLIQPETEVGQKFKRMLPGLLYTPPYFAKYTNEINFDNKGQAIYPLNYPKLYDFKDLDDVKRRFPNVMDSGMVQAMETAQQHAKSLVESISVNNKNDLNIYELQGTLEGVPDLLENMTPDQVVNTILYRVAIHEFGHNLGLRHNFFGSVDKSNFAKDQVLKVSENGQLVDKNYSQTTASVMDYLSLSAELHAPYDWEAYDDAALSFLYTGGLIDHTNDSYEANHPLAGQKKHFLYCTDEHRFSNAMCKAYDHGSTPTEIVMSMIDNFQRGYWTRNRRFGRPYWNASGYDSRVFSDLWDIKRFILFDQDSFTVYNSKIKDLFKTVKADTRQQEVIMDFVQADLRRAIKLSIAFYNAILQQSGAERNYYSFYDEPTGTLLRKGTFSDKFYATYFLMGDDGFFYNPNSPSTVASYLVYYNDPDIVGTLEDVSLNLLSRRVQADPWFITYNRMLYTQNIMNVANQNNDVLKRRLKMSCYRIGEFKDLFGIDPLRYQYRTNSNSTPLVADILNIQADIEAKPAMSKFQDTEYSLMTGDLGIALVDKKFVYVAAKAENDIAFSVIKNLSDEYLRGDGSEGDALGRYYQDLRDLRYFYNNILGTEDICQ